MPGDPNEYEVVYKAVADFADVMAKAAALRAELKALQAETERWHQSAGRVQATSAAHLQAPLSAAEGARRVHEASAKAAQTEKKATEEANSAHRAGLPILAQYRSGIREQALDIDALAHSQLRYVDALNLTAKQLKSIRDLEKHEQTLQQRDELHAVRTRATRAAGMIRADTLQDARLYKDLEGEARAGSTGRIAVERAGTAADRRIWADLREEARSLALALRLAADAADRDARAMDAAAARRLKLDQLRTDGEQKAARGSALVQKSLADLSAATSRRTTAENSAAVSTLRRGDIERQYAEAQARRAAQEAKRAEEAARPRTVLDIPSFQRAFGASIDKLLRDIRRTEGVLGREPATPRQVRAAARSAARSRRQRPGQAAVAALGDFGSLGLAVAKGLITGLRETEGAGRVLAAARGGLAGGLGARGPTDPPGPTLGGAFNNAADAVLGGLLKLGRTMFSWRGLIVLAVAALGPLSAALGALGAVALAVGGNLFSLGGALAALPGLFGAGLSAVGALVVGLLGMGGVLKALAQQQALVNAGSAQLGETQRLAARKTADAQHELASASRAVTDAQFQERQAQIALNDARRQATRDLEDLLTELGRASLNEDAAVLALQRAEYEYRRTLADPGANLLDREEGLLRVRQAENDLADVRRKNQRTAQDAALAQQRGVEGAPAVVSANKAVADAQYATVNAAYELKKATENLTLAQQEQAAGGPELLAVNRALKAALENLGPNARRVAVALIEQAGAWQQLKRDVGEAIFTPIAGQLSNLLGLLPLANRLLSSTGSAVGEVIAKGIEMVRADGPWQADWGALIDANAGYVRNLGGALLSVVSGFKDIAVAAIPFTTAISGAVKDVAGQFRDWAAQARSDNSIQAFLADTYQRLALLWGIAKNLGLVLYEVFYGASKDFSRDWLISFKQVTDGWAAWSRTIADPNSGFQKWLHDVKPLVSAVGGLVAALGRAITGLAADPANIREAKDILDALATKILPPLVGIFRELSQSHVLSDIVSGIGEIFSSIQHYLAGGGVLPLQVFFSLLVGIFRILAAFIATPGVTQVFSLIATGLGALAAASVLYKLAGFFKLTDALQWLLRNSSGLFGFFERLFGPRVANFLAGNIASGAQAAANTQVEAARLQQGAADTMLIAARTMVASAEGNAAAGLLGGSGGTGAGKAAITAEEEAAAKAAAAGAAKTGIVGRAGGWLGKLGTGARGFAAIDPLTWVGIGLGLLSDSGALGRPQSPLATIGRAGGAVATGAGIGATFGGPAAPITAVAGGVAGGIYSLARDRNLRQMTGDFFRSPLGALLGAPTGIGLIMSGLANFTNVLGNRRRTPAQQLVGQYKDADTELARMVQAGNTQGAAQTFDQLAQEAAKAGISIDELRTALPKYSAAVKDNHDAQLRQIFDMDAGTRATEAYTNAIKAIPNDAGHAGQALKDYGRLLDTINTSQLSSVSKVQAFSDILDGIAANASPNADKLGLLRDAFGQIAGAAIEASTKADLLRRTVDQMAAPFADVVDATDNWTTAEQQYKDAAAKSATTIDKKTGYVKQNNQELKAAIRASKDIFFADIASGVNPQKALDAHNKRMDQLIAESGLADAGKKKLDEYIQKYSGIPRELPKTVVGGLDEATMKAAEEQFKKLIVDGYIAAHAMDPNPETLYERAEAFADAVITGQKAAASRQATGWTAGGGPPVPSTPPSPPAPTPSAAPAPPSGPASPGDLRPFPGGDHPDPGIAPGAPGIAPNLSPFGTGRLAPVSDADLAAQRTYLSAYAGYAAMQRANPDQAARQFETAEKRVHDALAHTNKKFDDRHHLLDDQKDKIKQAIAASWEQYYADIRTGNLSETDAMAKHQTRMKRLQDESGQNQTVRGDVQGLINTYGKVPPDKNTNVTVTGLPDVLTQLKELEVQQIMLRDQVSYAQATKTWREENPAFGGRFDPRGGPGAGPPGSAEGGPVYGPGGPTEDLVRAVIANQGASVPAWAEHRLSPGEHVLSANEVRLLGGHQAVLAFRQAVVSGQLPLRARYPGDGSMGLAFRDGGPVDETPWRFDVGLKRTHIPTLDELKNQAKFGPMYAGPMTGSVTAIQAWIKAQAGKPYIWAAAGPQGFDCSGAQSAVWNLIHGRSAYSHTFSTSNEAAFFPKPGYGGVFTAGWTNPGERGPGGSSVGHTAGIFAGLPFESRGGDGFTIGDRVTPIGAFAHIGHFDRGGLLPPGITLARNDTGNFETIRNATQEAVLQGQLSDLYGALNTAVRSVNVPAGTPGAAGLPYAVTHNVTHNSGLTLGDITINNPVRERAATSLRRQLMTLSYLGL